MSADVLVVGGGVGGLAAALAAAESGADVTLLEAGGQLGGAAQLSNGSVWTFSDLETYLEHCPGADPDLAGRVVAGLPATVHWLRAQGVAVRDRGPSLYGAERSYQVTPAQLVDQLSRALRARASVLTSRRVTEFDATQEGARAITDDRAETWSRTVVLATGGIHADASMLEAAGLSHYVGLPRRNRSRSGDGLRMALAQGASIGGTADGIYGHLVPTGLAEEDVRSSLAAQYHSYAGVLVGVDGSLLAGPGTDDHDLNRVVARLPAHRALLFFDNAAAPPRIHAVVGGTSWAGDRADFATTHGRRAATSASVGELVATVQSWGCAPLSPESRAALPDALRVAPFTVVEVEPSITHAGAGIRVDAALHAEGLSNVLVAGADIGNAFGDGYGGGLAFALTTGLAAGRRAAILTDRKRAKETRGFP